MKICLQCGNTITSKYGTKYCSRKCTSDARVGLPGKNQYLKAKETGIPFVISDSTREKMRRIGKQFSDAYWANPENRQRHSEIMSTTARNNPDQYNKSNRGGCKRIHKHGLDFIGQWELDFFEWCTINEIHCIRPNIGFGYFWNGRTRTYYPDFYLPKYDIWVEIKGYLCDRDIAKWAAFPYNLAIIKKSEIKEIRNSGFNLTKYIQE